MEKVYYKGNPGSGEYEVLTYEEARARNLCPVIWRDAEEPGWVLSDDGYAFQCLRVLHYEERKDPSSNRKPRHRRLVNTVVGRFWGVKGSVILWERIRESRSRQAVAPMGWTEREARKTRTRRMAKLYAMMLLAGRVDWHVLSVVWKPEQIVPGWRVRKLLREEVVLEMVTKETYALMKARGVTPDYVIEKMMKAVDLAELKGDGGTILKACADFRGMLGMEHVPGKLPEGTFGEGSQDASFEDVVAQAERELHGESGEMARPQLPSGVRE